MTRTPLFLVLALAACTGTTAKEKSGKTAKPPSTDAQNQGAGEDGDQTGSDSAGATISDGSGAATIYVANDSVETVCFVYLGDGNGNWTDDLLGDSNVLDPGYYLTITGIAPGFVELYAQGCDSSDWYSSGDVSDSYTFILTGGDDTGYYDTGVYARRDHPQPGAAGPTLS